MRRHIVPCHVFVVPAATGSLLGSSRAVVMTVGLVFFSGLVSRVPQRPPECHGDALLWQYSTPGGIAPFFARRHLQDPLLYDYSLDYSILFYSIRRVREYFFIRSLSSSSSSSSTSRHPPPELLVI